MSFKVPSKPNHPGIVPQTQASSSQHTDQPSPPKGAGTGEVLIRALKDVKRQNKKKEGPPVAQSGLGG